MKRKNKWLLGTAAVLALGVAFWPSSNETLEAKVEEPVKERRFDRAEIRKRLLEINKRIELPKEEVVEEDFDLLSCLRCEDWEPKMKRIYYSNGQIWGEASFSCDQLHGQLKTWWSNGQLMKVEDYFCGKLEGRVIQWNKEGYKWSEENYKNGKKHGESFSWYMLPGGKEQFGRDPYFEGKRHGWREFWEDNIKTYEEYNIHGKTHGKIKSWFYNGQLQSEFNIVDDEKQGDMISYHENGQLEQIVPYVDDKRHGKMITYDELGNVVRESYYDKDKLQKTIDYTGGEAKVTRRVHLKPKIGSYPDGQLKSIEEGFSIFSNDSTYEGGYKKIIEFYPGGSWKTMIEINDYPKKSESHKTVVRKDVTGHITTEECINGKCYKK